MSCVRIQTGATEPIEIMAVDAAGVRLTGLGDLKVQVRRISNGYFFDWTDNTFKAEGSVVRLLQALEEVSATGAPGEYRLNAAPHVKGFNTAAIVNPIAGDVYRVTVVQDGGAEVDNVPQIGEIKVGDWVDYVDAPISGLLTVDDMRSVIREFGLDHLVSVNPGIVPPAAGTYIRQILDALAVIDGAAVYWVQQAWGYNPQTNVLTGQVWLEHHNLVYVAPTSVVVTWYESDGSAVFTETSVVPTAQGVFEIVKPGPGLERNRAYHAIATFDVPGYGAVSGCKGTLTIG